MLNWIADAVALLVLGVITYILCLAVDRKAIAQLIALVSVMLLVLVTIQDLTPVINKAKARAQVIEQKVDRLTAPIDAVNGFREKLEQSPIVQWGAPTGLKH